MSYWKECPKCQEVAEIPSVMEKIAALVHTDNALSIMYECPNCGAYLTAHISYRILEIIAE